MSGRRITRWILAVALAVAAMPAAGQDKPYAGQLGRLAEILGSLHYLTGLCDTSPSPYRGQMAAILDAEAPGADFRAQLIDRFNLGYSSFAAVYRRCTAAAREAIDLYRVDGAALAAEITERYGATAPPNPPDGVAPAPTP